MNWIELMNVDLYSLDIWNLSWSRSGLVRLLVLILLQKSRNILWYWCKLQQESRFGNLVQKKLSVNFGPGKRWGIPPFVGPYETVYMVPTRLDCYIKMFLYRMVQLSKKLSANRHMVLKYTTWDRAIVS